MCYIHKRNEEGGVFEGEAEGGVTVWRSGRCCWSGGVEVEGSAHTHITHTFISSQITYVRTHGELDSFEEGAARAAHLPVCYVFHLRCGWMEDRAKCFHSRSSRKKKPWPTVTSDRAGEKKVIDFTVLEDAYSAVVSGGGSKSNQKIKNTAC